MTIAIQIAAPPEPAHSRPGPQPISTLLRLAPIAGPEDRAMSQGSHVITLLTNLTDNEIDALAPLDRRCLQDQLERVHCMLIGTSIGEATTPESGEPRRGRAAFLDELRDGRGRE